MVQKELKYLLYYLLVIAILISCNYFPSNQNKDLVKYFDLEEYFNDEISRLKEEKLYLVKQFELNDSDETDTLLVIDWEKELSFFKDANINKPTLYGLYNVDTIIHSALNFSILYKAAEHSLKTQIIKITYNKGRINSIRIENQVDNIFYSATEMLKYVSGEQYQIRKTQHIIGTKQENMDICGVWFKFQ